MSSAKSILRSRRRRTIAGRGLRRWIVASAAAVVILTLTGGGISWAAATVFEGLTADLPPVQQLEQILGRRGQERFVPPVLTDRSGEFVIDSPSGPSAGGSQWLGSSEAGDSPLMPMAAADAAVAALDPTFWSNPGYEASAIFSSLGRGLPIAPGITERLVDITLLPLQPRARPAGATWLRRAIQAARLSDTYPKAWILEWFLNVADFGRGAFGIDAAARAYFGKPGHDLTLAQSASLVGLLLEPTADLAEDQETARQSRNRVLETMQEQGLIRAGEAQGARAEPLAWVEPLPVPAGVAAEFRTFVWDRFRLQFGSAPAGRPGLRVRTSLDYDLQLQADCTLRSQLARLRSGDPDAVLSAADGAPCLVAGLLSPLRPGDTDGDHAIYETAAVVIDSATGEVLAYLGPADAKRPAESAFRPLVYLTAFTRGYSPATMALDLPPEGEIPEVGSVYLGPIRMRIGMANGLVGATRHALSRLEIEQVFHLARQMGITGLEDAETAQEAGTEQVAASLLDLAYAYSVIAHEGRMTGVANLEPALPASRDVDPVVILDIEDATGKVYSAELVGQPVLGPALAYLMTDVLSDETARLPAAGGLSIGRVAGGVDGGAGGGRLRWTIGFSAPRVAGVWFSARENESLSAVDGYNGSAAIWRALLQYATRGLPPEPSARPPGVTEIDVCDPSGLLPTEYCPNVVRELFLEGTEPLHYDTLFRPYRVNRETGKLATLFTPLELVEERVYLIPPPEAEEWARQSGLEQPPTEYDTLGELTQTDPDVSVQRPIAFEVLRGVVQIRGTADPDDLDFYRLQIGEGLNPTHWLSLGDEVRRSVENGVLGRWDTTGQDGLFTLQLIVVDAEGRVRTAAVPLILDNQPPSARLVRPFAGQQIDLSQGQDLVLEAEAADSVALAFVEFFLDGRRVGSVATAPYSLRWSAVGVGDHNAYLRAYDSVGNVTQSDPVLFAIVP